MQKSADSNELLQLTIRPWERALARFHSEHLTYGSVLTEEWLYETFDIPYPGPQVSYGEAQKSLLAALSARQRFFEELLTKHQMAVISDRSAGSGSYVVVDPGDQTALAVREARKDFGRAIDRMQALTLNVNIERLSNEQRKENADALARASNLASMMKQIWPSRRPSRQSASDAA